MIPKLIILCYFVPLCSGCLQTAQRSEDAVIQRTADSADSDVITPNAQVLPSSNVQKAKQNNVVDLSTEAVGNEESSAVSQIKLSSGIIETAETDQAVHVKRGRKLAISSKQSVRTSAVPRKNNLAQTMSSETEASSATAKTKAKKTFSPSSSVITKSTLPNEGDESEKLLPEDFEAEEKKAVEEETEQGGMKEERKEAGENEAAEREAEETKSSENQAGGTEVDKPGDKDDENEIEKKRTEENEVGEEEVGKEDTTSRKAGETVAGEKGEEQNKAAEKVSQKIELPETGQRLTSVTLETYTKPKVPEEINLCHTCDLSNLQKIMGNDNETSQFYEPYIGERTFSATGCAQTLAYCNVPLYLGKWPDNFMEFHPVGPMYRAVRGGGLASEISCSKDGQWKVGSRNIVGVSCIHE